MDEPTSTLDLYRQIDVLEFVADLATRTGMIVLIALHDLNQRCATAPPRLSSPMTKWHRAARLRM